LKKLRDYRSLARVAAWVVIVALYAVCCVRCVKNLDTPTLWYDEAGQFYMARGLHHWSEIDAPDGSIADVVYNNAHYNLDPGGFTMLLRLWVKVSADHVWLRAFPMLFFFLSIVLTWMLVHRITRDKLLAAVAGLLLFCIDYGTLPYFFRPYSMELAGVILGAYFAVMISERVTLGRVMAASVLLSVFLTARYAGLMAIFVDCCFILYFILTDRGASVRRRVLTGVAFSVPLLTSVALCWWLAMRIQNPEAGPLSYISYLCDDMTPLRSVKALILYAFIVVMVVFRRRVPRPVWILFLLSTLTQVLFMGLSFAGMQPWLLWSCKGAFLFVLYAVSLFVAVGLLLRRCLPAAYPLILAAVMSFQVWSMIGRYQSMSVNPAVDNKTYAGVDMLRALDLEKFQNVMICPGAVPGVRYLYEFGVLKDRREEYDRFVVLSGVTHEAHEPEVYKEMVDECVQENVRQLDALPSGALVIDFEDISLKCGIEQRKRLNAEYTRYEFECVEDTVFNHRCYVKK